jgi:guanosine-3',5'-bis(diphosphate) 3'-pyrophosphohydrolase
MDTLKILKAAHFAASKHSKQKRKGEDAIPYINHPIEVAMLIAEVGEITDTEVLIAAILHDTIEDTETTSKEVEAIFGKRVLDLVLEVTDDKSLPKLTRKQLQVEHAPSLSPEATLIKIADKISNIKGVIHSPPVKWTHQRRKEYLEWAEKVIGSCKKVNSALEAHFYKTLEEGREALLNKTAVEDR